MPLENISELRVNILIRGGQQYKVAKQEVDARATQFASGGDSNEIHHLIRFLKAILPPLQAVEDEPGMTELAIANGYSGDVVAQMSVLLTAIETAIPDIVALFPTSGGFILSHSYDAQNNLVPRTLTGPQLAPLIAKLNEISAAVE